MHLKHSSLAVSQQNLVTVKALPDSLTGNKSEFIQEVGKLYQVSLCSVMMDIIHLTGHSMIEVAKQEM